MKWAFVICSWNAEKIWKYINFWRLLAVILLLWTICFRHNTNQEWVFSSLFLQQTMQLLHPLKVFCLVTLTRTSYIYVSLVRREKATITNPCDYISSVVWLYAVLICINSPIDKSSTCVFFRVEIKVSLLSVDSIIRRFSLFGKQIRTQMSRINAHKGQLKCKFSTAENGDNQSRMCVCLCVCMCLWCLNGNSQGNSLNGTIWNQLMTHTTTGISGAFKHENGNGEELLNDFEPFFAICLLSKHGFVPWVDWRMEDKGI